MKIKAGVEEKIERIYDMFETSFLHRDEELILHKKWNIYFRIVVDLWPKEGSRPITSDEFDYKLLSYLSFYCADNYYIKAKAEWCKRKLNRWFRKVFTHDELQVIYQKLGCGANMSLGVEFIKSGLNMDLLNA